jgi:hypothetical protein
VTGPSDDVASREEATGAEMPIMSFLDIQIGRLSDEGVYATLLKASPNTLNAMAWCTARPSPRWWTPPVGMASRSRSGDGGSHRTFTFGSLRQLGPI